MLTIMRWQSRQLLPTTILFAFLAACWTLFCSDVLQPLLTPYVAPAVILHGVLMCWQLGRNSPRHSGFLYIQGFSRDQIWWGTVTATLAAAALVSLTVWLFITTHTRSAVQAALGNPWFPAAGSSDADCVFALFALYVIVLGIGHLAWVRSHLPEAHASAGWQLGVILTISLMISINYGSNEFVERRTIVWLVPAAACLVIAWRSHRKSEVQA